MRLGRGSKVASHQHHPSQTDKRVIAAGGIHSMRAERRVHERHVDSRGSPNPTLTVAGVMINQHEEHTVSGKTWLDELEAAAGARGLSLLDPPIPKKVVISDATEAARGLDEWGGAEARALAAIYATHPTAIEGESA